MAAILKIFCNAIKSEFTKGTPKSEFIEKTNKNDDDMHVFVDAALSFVNFA